MHVIVDEIYALSVFDTSAPHQSVLSLDDLPDPEKTHVLWGLTKVSLKAFLYPMHLNTGVPKWMICLFIVLLLL